MLLCRAMGDGLIELHVFVDIYRHLDGMENNLLPGEWPCCTTSGTPRPYGSIIECRYQPNTQKLDSSYTCTFRKVKYKAVLGIDTIPFNNWVSVLPSMGSAIFFKYVSIISIMVAHVLSLFILTEIQVFYYSTFIYSIIYSFFFFMFSNPPSIITFLHYQSSAMIGFVQEQQA